MFVKIFRWILISLSLYSRIPVFKFDMTEDDMKNSLMFFPFVGVIIAAVTIALYHFFEYAGVDNTVTALILVVVPIVITGGFHLDGFMDTEDALRSYRSKEDKLKILKDPHIGAFAVIGLLICIITAIASVRMLLDAYDARFVYLMGCMFVMSRSLSGITSLTMKKAKDDGMLAGETKKAAGFIMISQAIWLIVSAVTALYIYPIAFVFLSISCAVCVFYYSGMVKKQFGGVTGDTAGYLVTVIEVSAVTVLAIFCILTGL